MGKIIDAYNSIMFLEESYKVNRESGKVKFNDSFMYMCNLVGVRIRHISELTQDNVDKILGLKLYILGLNAKTPELDLEQKVALGSRLDIIHSTLLKINSGVTDVSTIYNSDGNLLISNLDLFLTISNIRNFPEEVFANYWDMNPISEVMVIDSEDMEPYRVVLEMFEGEAVYLRSTYAGINKRYFQILSRYDLEKLKKQARGDFKKTLERLSVVPQEDLNWKMVKVVTDLEFKSVRAIKRLGKDIKLVIKDAISYLYLLEEKSTKQG